MSYVIIEKSHLQATSIKIKNDKTPLVISALYCPPKYKIKLKNFVDFYKTLDHRFIARGDYNTKHPLWRSRLYNKRTTTLPGNGKQ